MKNSHWRLASFLESECEHYTLQILIFKRNLDDRIVAFWLIAFLFSFPLTDCFLLILVFLTTITNFLYDCKMTILGKDLIGFVHEIADKLAICANFQNFVFVSF